MNVGVLVFPGTSGELDCRKAVEATIGDAKVEYVWHTTADLSKYDCLIVPGGFSYGDYLRAGAVAARSTNAVRALKEEAERGKLVLGISNGFQILLEAGLLPGAMLPNRTLKFRCQPTRLKVANAATPFTRDYAEGEIISIPVAHGEGQYVCDEATLRELGENGQIVFRYADGNPDGPLDDIAGICNRQGNVLGMMPLPERAVDQLLGSEDGRRLFTSILNTWRERHGAAVTG